MGPNPPNCIVALAVVVSTKFARRINIRSDHEADRGIVQRDLFRLIARLPTFCEQRPTLAIAEANRTIAHRTGRGDP
jgi:hypothetical protein